MHTARSYQFYILHLLINDKERAIYWHDRGIHEIFAHSPKISISAHTLNQYFLYYFVHPTEKTHFIQVRRDIIVLIKVLTNDKKQCVPEWLSILLSIYTGNALLSFTSKSLSRSPNLTFIMENSQSKLV